VKLGDHVIIAEPKRRKKLDSAEDGKKRKKGSKDADKEEVNDEMVLRITEIFFTAKVRFKGVEVMTSYDRSCNVHWDSMHQSFWRLVHVQRSLLLPT
jgi:hypothetical protein